MPANKSAVTRYRIIDHALLSKGVVSKQELIRIIREATGIKVSLRTITDDISNMRDDTALGFFAPIKHSRKEKGYYYEDKSYSISNIPVSSEEIRNLLYGIKSVANTKGLFDTGLARDSVHKLMKAVNSADINRRGPGYPVVETDQVPAFTDQSMFDQLREACIDRKMIKIRYQAFHRDAPNDWIYLHPYLLKAYRNRWYLVGLNESAGEIRIYGLERILNIQWTDSKFQESFDPAEYFRYAIGITVFNDQKPQEIVLQFAPSDAAYVRTVPLHHSQQILRDNSNGLTVKITVFNSHELRMLIRSYGPGVKVLKPRKLAAEIAEDAEKTRKLYL